MIEIRITEETKHGNPRFVVDLRKFKKGRLYFKTREDAETERDKLAEEMAHYGITGLDFSLHDRMAVIDAKERLAPFGVSIREAVDFYVQNNHAAETKKLSDAIEAAYWAKVNANKTEIYTNKFHCNLLLFSKGRENVLVSKITQTDAESWIFKNNWAPWTRKSRLTDLRTFFEFCIKKRWCIKNPCQDIERIVTEDLPPGILTVAQTSSLLESALTKKTDTGASLISMLPYLILGTFCGLRPSEIERTTWSQIKTERGFVEVENRKLRSRKNRFVTLHPAALRWLQLCDKTLPVWPVNLNRRMAQLRTLAKVTEWPHDCMRHSFGSYHYAKFGDANKTASEMGHLSADMLFTNYRNKVTPEEAEAFWNIMPPTSEPCNQPHPESP